MKKTLIMLFTIGAVLWPSVSMAQLDQRCWRKNDCENADIGGKFVSNEESKASCGTKDAIGTKLGFCLPIEPAVTAVSFGGKRTFNNVAEFFKYIYQYGIQVAGILAVFMLIVGGVEWLLSAGSPDRIGRAKRRISGAIIGLVIALVSFTFLNIINPYLVELRLPNIWMINKKGLAPPNCAEAKKPLAYYKENKETKTDAEKEKIFKESKFLIPAAPKDVEEYLKKNPGADKHTNTVPMCGYEYFVEGAGLASCSGYVCSENWTCSLYTYNKKNELVDQPKCENYVLKIVMSVDDFIEKTKASLLGSTGGSVAGTFGIAKLNSPEWWGDHGDDDWDLYGVCSDFTLSKNRIAAWDSATAKTLVPKGDVLGVLTLSWKNNIIDVLKQGCGTKEVVGTILVIDLNESGTSNDYNLWIGRDGPNEAMAGVYRDINLRTNYFPLQGFGPLHGENFYELEITNHMLTEIRADKDSEPSGSFATKKVKN